MAAAKRLTALGVAAINPTQTKEEYSDTSGVRLSVQPSGHKSWLVRFRINGKLANMNLGTFPAISLATARVLATTALSKVAAGVDPRDEKKAAKVVEVGRAGDTVDRWFAEFLTACAKEVRPNTLRQYQHCLNNIVLPKWRGLTVHDLRRRDVIKLLNDTKEGRPVMANRCLAALSRLFSWLMAQDVVASSPCLGVEFPHKEVARDRTLTDAEIVALLRALDAVGGPSAAAVRFMLLTGQRRNEVSGMRWSEIKGDQWVLAPERMKGGKEHAVPLSVQALELINDMPQLGGDFVFSSDGVTAVNSFSRTKIALDAIMRPATPWTLHDLRRTVASNLARLKIQLPVVEKILAHSSGTFRGIVSVYQKYDFAAEKRAALQAWADGVDRLVRGEDFIAEEGDKVVRLPRRA